MNKSILLEQTVVEIEGCLKERDTSADHGFSSPANGEEITRPRSTSGAPTANRLDRRQIEQRIEEDRERHKRMRESMWAVPDNLEDEALKFLEEMSDWGEDDEIRLREEREEFLEMLENTPTCHHLREKQKQNGNSSH